MLCRNGYRQDTGSDNCNLLFDNMTSEGLWASLLYVLVTFDAG